MTNSARFAVCLPLAAALAVAPALPADAGIRSTKLAGSSTGSSCTGAILHATTTSGAITGRAYVAEPGRAAPTFKVRNWRAVDVWWPAKTKLVVERRKSVYGGWQVVKEYGRTKAERRTHRRGSDVVALGSLRSGGTIRVTISYC